MEATGEDCEAPSNLYKVAPCVATWHSPHTRHDRGVVWGVVDIGLRYSASFALALHMRIGVHSVPAISNFLFPSTQVEGFRNVRACFFGGGAAMERASREGELRAPRDSLRNGP